VLHLSYEIALSLYIAVEDYTLPGKQHQFFLIFAKSTI